MKLHLDDEPIGDVTRLHLGPGDTLLVQLHRPTDAKTVHEISDRLKDWLGDDIPCLITDGADFSILSASGENS